MTVRELRRALFEIENQEAEVVIDVDGTEWAFMVNLSVKAPIVYLSAR